MAYSLTRDGFELVPSGLTENQVEVLKSALATLAISPGHRNLMHRVPAVAELAQSRQILELLEKRMDCDVFPVRSIFFDKTADANWLVPWHQDLSIAVKHRIDVAGYGPWSVKENVPHVQPPVEILERLITIRLHLDGCDESNGALQVIAGSHARGRLSAAEIARMRNEDERILCPMRAGDALLIRPLLLHGSAAAAAPTHRRVIHLEYASCALDGGLEWAEAATRHHGMLSTSTGPLGQGLPSSRTMVQ